MALPSIGGGRQLGDGNTNELEIGTQAAPPTATSTATLTVAQVTGGILVGNPSTSAASYTLPTAALLDATLVNARVDSSFDLYIVNLGTSTGVITILAGTGITLSGLATIAITSSAHVRFRRTGAAAWTMYRLGS